MSIHGTLKRDTHFQKTSLNQFQQSSDGDALAFAKCNIRYRIIEKFFTKNYKFYADDSLLAADDLAMQVTRAQSSG